MLKSLSASLLALLLFIGCDAAPQLSIPTEPVAQPSVPQASSTSVDSGIADNGTIRIASYNIQVFGVSKMGKPHVMEILADVARRFDVIAIQEIRSVDQTILPRFVDLINAEGARYAYLIGPRLGRTSSKEQYAFVYNTERIELGQASAYTVNDPQDLLHREPFVAYFRVRGPSPERAFTFKLANIHTDPDETDTELDALADVFVAVQRASTEDDLILLGDLNVDEYDLGRLGQLPGIAYAISGTTTNTRRNKLYDNLVFDGKSTAEFTGRAGVLDLMAEYGLTEEQALDVSDHFPVWAEFDALEAGVGDLVAERPSEVLR
jgi:endonuclease/exonuclease/phosphatase family metal-dependent hydrolase